MVQFGCFRRLATRFVQLEVPDGTVPAIETVPSEEAIDQPRYADVTVESVRVQTDQWDVTHSPRRVVVVLGVPPEEHSPGLSALVADTFT